jgi:imidazoleglycerol-phosphate dehydratase
MAAGRPSSRVPLRARIDTTGTGQARVATGLPVLDELLALLALSSGFDLDVESHEGGGEAEVDAVGYALGEALAEVLAVPPPRRIADATAPADEALAHVALEVSGRPLLVANVDLTDARLGGLQGDLLHRFLEALAQGAGLTLHVRLLHGEETSHVVYAIVKALGLALGQAARS